jgi:hypothetical protein
VELPRIKAAKVFVFNPPVLLANAFTALILNLVRARQFCSAWKEALPHGSAAACYMGII